MNLLAMKLMPTQQAFANGIEAQIPVEGSVARGWEPYDYPNTNEGYEAAKAGVDFTPSSFRRKRSQG